MSFRIIQDRFDAWIGSDGSDLNYKGSDPEPRYMNDIIETKYGRMSIREYQQRCKDERCTNN